MELLPSWPEPFDPQHFTAPAFVSAHVWPEAGRDARGRRRAGNVDGDPAARCRAVAELAVAVRPPTLHRSRPEQDARVVPTDGDVDHAGAETDRGTRRLAEFSR